MNQVVAQNFGPVSSVFAGVKPEDDLSAGVQASFGLIGYKGKVWSIRYRGDERQLMRDDGDGPRGSIEVVVLKASPVISKIWYEQGYVEGSTSAPDCFSTNGVVPEPTSLKRQAPACANCPRNVWGSRITPAGKNGKECADSKRLAVVPSGDIANEMFGGPMLLRVPAASLQDMAQFGMKMQGLGYPYYAISTRVSFDAAEAYPKFQFQAIRPLTDDEAKQVMELRESPTVSRILAEDVEYTPTHDAAAPRETLQSVFEQPPQNQETPLTTGVASTPPVQTAPMTGRETLVSTPSSSAPATKMESGDASSATVKTSGFGTMAAPAAAKPNQKLADSSRPTNGKASTGFAQPADTTGLNGQIVSEQGTAQDIAEQSQSGDVYSAISSFEDELDAKLAGLLPDLQST